MSTRIAVRKILVGLLGAILTTTVIFNTRHPPAKGDGNMLVAFAAANAHRVVPRTVVVIERVTSPSGEYAQRRTMKAVRGDGSEIQSEQMLSADGAVIDDQRTLVFASRLKVLVHAASRLKSTLRIPMDEYVRREAGRLDPSRQCMATTNGIDMNAQNSRLLGVEEIGGIKAFKIAVNERNMSSKLTMWLAPELDCDLVKQTVEIRNGKGEFEGTSTKTLETALLSEPDPALFSLPEGHAEVAPSELNRRVMAKAGGPAATGNPAMEDAMDKQYWANRP